MNDTSAPTEGLKMNDNSAPTEGLNTMPPVLDELADPLEADWFSDEADFNVPVRGTIRNGTIASVSRGEILIDIGAKSEGVIASREMESMSRESRSRLSVGDEVEVYVVNPEDRDGNIILSIARAEEEIDWRWAESLLESQEVLEGEISGYNKGGLLVQMRRVRGFVPASQLDNIRRDIRYGSSPDERWAQRPRRIGCWKNCRKARSAMAG